MVFPQQAIAPKAVISTADEASTRVRVRGGHHEVVSESLPLPMIYALSYATAMPYASGSRFLLTFCRLTKSKASGGTRPAGFKTKI